MGEKRNNKQQYSNAIKIKSIQAASLYRYNNGYKFVLKQKKTDGSYNIQHKESYLDFGNAVINNSMFAKYVRKHGVVVNKRGESLDFLMMKFDWGVDEDASDEKEIKPSVTTKKLRDYYYKNGTTVVWKKYDSKTGKTIVGAEKTITYKMLLRTTGKAKEGDCLFIREELHEKILNYITMGLWKKMPDKEGAKIVEMSAYAPLITATAIDYISIPLENIFVLKDQKSFCNKKAITVKTKNVEHTRKTKDYPALKECFCKREDSGVEIVNILWDGMGCIDNSLFPSNMEGFIYCRSHFFKSCLFKGNIQDFFRDYYGENYDTAYVTDMTGRKIKVTDIKVIVTENSLKWTKFLELMSESGTMEDGFKYYHKIMKKSNSEFEIVKTAHGSKYEEWQRSSFQMNNTLLTTDCNILKSIASASIDYCNELKMNDEAFLKYLEITGSAKCSINNVLIDLYRQNDNFRYTEYFKTKRIRKINELKDKRLKLGKLFQHGDNLTICGNPVAMLMEVVGEKYMDEGCFEQKEDRIQCCTSRFDKGEMLAGFRSPHNSPNNIIYLENVYPDKVMKYFPELGNTVIIINGIGTDVQSRLNGQDLDTDSIYTTNQKEIVKLAKKAYMECPTIINDIGSDVKNKYTKSMASYSEMDSDISSAQYSIGLASNIAQLALSYWFDGGCKDEKLEDVFIICSVLAQVAIDSCKRNFEINVRKELARIKKLPCMKHTPRYPRFYADIQKYKHSKKRGNKLKIKESDIGFFNCPMDLLYKIIEEGVIDMRKHKEMNMPTYRGIRVFFEYKADKVCVDRKQYKKVIGIVQEYNTNIKKLDKAKDSYYEDKLNEFEICMEKLKNLTITKDTMYTLIAYAFQPGNKKIRDSMLISLYDKNKTLFLNCFIKTEKSPQKG